MIILMKVVGIGQCSLDHLFVIDSFPEPDTKKEVLEWTIAGGGPVATALASLSRLGIACSFHGIIGDDEGGRKIADSLISENIDISGLLVRPGACSQTAFIAVEQGSGKRTIFWKRPSAGPLLPGELQEGFLDSADLILVDGLMTEVSLHAAQAAKKRNIPVMLDAGKLREGMPELAQICDYVVCSAEFAGEFTRSDPSSDPEGAVLAMKPFGAKAVTITLGDQGSITLCENAVFRTPAFRVNTVDTTGAGDVFHGGYIYGLLQKWPIREVVRFASAFAALKCRALGGRAGIAKLEEVHSLLKEERR